MVLRFDVGCIQQFWPSDHDRDYRPYFLGERGAASLNQYFGMQQILPELKDNTAVYVVSPQWFTKKGYDSSAFQQFFNSDQLNSFIANHQQDARIRKYAAEAPVATVSKCRLAKCCDRHFSRQRKFQRFDPVF
ncbi:MAG: D-alanyl-lipoteichoic acid biosynthesis protein DltD [Streptococcus sp.]